MKRAMVLMMSICLIFISLPAMADTLVSFSGSGSSGTDPYGNQWLLNESVDNQGTYMWGIPGYLAGYIDWDGPVTISDFHVTFADGWLVDENPVPTSWTGSDDSTRFSNLSDEVLWSRSISGSTVDFFAASGDDVVDIGDYFFVNVHFLAPATGAALPPFDFTASYTYVPEPTTILLLGLGITGLAVIRRKI